MNYSSCSLYSSFIIFNCVIVDENGNIKEESHYEYGIRYGTHKIYDENNRKLIFEYEYKNGVIINMKKK